MGLLPGGARLNRYQLEHLIRAAGAVTDSTELIVIGSQAILGALPHAPESLLVSEEADLFVRERPELSILIDGSIGELSPFHQTFGYYGHGVGPETAVLAPGWDQRLVEVRNDNTKGVTGWCLHPSDIAYSKLAAGRPKDLRYCELLLTENLVGVQTLRDRIQSRPELQEVLSERLKLISCKLRGA
jgi:hypothetical protein